MTPDKAELLHHYRRLIAKMQREMDDFQEAGMRLLNGADEDVTEAHMAKMQKMIERLEALVEKHDPEGFTVLR